MKLLLVEDEPGLREGLAAFLKLKGVTVRTAESLAQGLAALDEDDFDVVVTDWRLKDGVARQIVQVSPASTIVVSGHPGEVEAEVSCRTLLKPVQPKVLLANALELHERFLAGPEVAPAVWNHDQGTGREGAAVPDRAGCSQFPDDNGEACSDLTLAKLPADTRAFLRLALALLGDAQDVELQDDGAFVTLSASVPMDQLARARKIEQLGGDLRVQHSTPTCSVVWRVHRDGRPADSGTLCQPEDVWPEGDVCVDFSAPCCVDRFMVLLEQATFASSLGRRVRFLHVPDHLRLCAETFGKAGDMPKRDPVGPRLPAELADLWR